MPDERISVELAVELEAWQSHAAEALKKFPYEGEDDKPEHNETLRTCLDDNLDRLRVTPMKQDATLEPALEELRKLRQ